MSRLDLSIYNKVDAEDWYERLRLEALRAQRSEDAEKARADKATKRVRVLEDAIKMARGFAYSDYFALADQELEKALAGGKESQ